MYKNQKHNNQTNPNIHIALYFPENQISVFNIVFHIVLHCSHVFINYSRKVGEPKIVLIPFTPRSPDSFEQDYQISTALWHHAFFFQLWYKSWKLRSASTHHQKEKFINLHINTLLCHCICLNGHTPEIIHYRMGIRGPIQEDKYTAVQTEQLAVSLIKNKKGK